MHIHTDDTTTATYYYCLSQCQYVHKLPAVVCQLTELSQFSSQQCQWNLLAQLTVNTQL